MSEPTTCPIDELLRIAEYHDSGSQQDTLQENSTDARLLRLAAAELWLRRRGKFPHESAWELQTNFDRPQDLPRAVFSGLVSNKIWHKQSMVIYCSDETAMRAAIEAVAKCLAEGTLKDE